MGRVPKPIVVLVCFALAVLVASAQDQANWQLFWVKTADDVKTPALWAAPAGEGPFPVVVFFHGAPGGVGEDGLRKIAAASRWQQFLQAGYLVCVADYRGHPQGKPFLALQGKVNASDDAAAIVRHLKSLPLADGKRICVMGGSLGGAVTLEALGKEEVACAVLNAPATFLFLGYRGRPNERKDRELADDEIDKKAALTRIDKIHCPVLIVQGTADGLAPLNRKLAALLKEANKDVQIELFEGQGHGFTNGPDGDACRKALQLTLEFIGKHTATTAVGAGDSQANREFVPLFDGQTLDDWVLRGGKAVYKVEDGAIVGTTVEGSPNTFLCTKKEYGDFELTFEVKCDRQLNSGVQVRSHAYAKDTPQPSNPTRIRLAGDVYGPQVEISADGNAGRIWDEARHAKWHDPEPNETARNAYKPDEWNRYRIVAQGDRIRTWINDVPVADIRVTEQEDASGFIGLQVHSLNRGETGPYQVRWRNIQIRELKPDGKIAALGLQARQPPGRARPTQPPEARVPEGVKVVRDLEYARVGEKQLLLDLYLPEKAEGTLPVIIGIHGGGWANGSKAGGQGSWLARYGYAVAVINYRLSGEAVFPAQIEDCKAAVRWLRANAHKYNLDPERFGAIGHSAGGHLVSLLATTGDVKEFDKGEHLEFSSRIQAACPLSGPTDFLQMDAHAPKDVRLKHDAPNSPEARLIGGPIQENKDKVAKANPITYVTQDDPPFLIVHGEQDPVVPAHQAELLHEALKQVGVEAKLHLVPGAGHAIGGREVNDLIVAFFDKQLKMGKKKDKLEERPRDARPAKTNPGPPRYATNLVIGYSQVAQWYPSFESVVDNDRWELLWQGGAGVDKWSNPNYEGWSRPIQSPCKVRSGDPDRVVLNISGPYGDDVDKWAQKIQETMEVIRSKYKNVKQIVLQPVVGGPGNSRAARQHPVIVKAIERVVKADKSGTVSSGPSPQVSSDKDFRDALGHLTREAAGSIGKQIGEYYSKLDTK